MSCCPSFIGDEVDIIVKAGAPVNRHWKFSTDGNSVTVKPLNFTFEDRQNRGHTRQPNNSYIECTITLNRGLFSNSFDFNDAVVQLNNQISEISGLFRMCDATVTLVGSCGDTYTMRSAVYTGDGTFDMREGTANLRFSSIYDVTDTNNSSPITGTLNITA